MKPFNLQEALEGKSVITRDGHKITSIHHFKHSESTHPVYAHIEGSSRVEKFNVEGKWSASGTLTHELDLFMEDEEYWINVYWDAENRRIWTIRLWESEEKALAGRDKGNQCLATLKVKL